jgi:hypothetical protein
MKKPLPIKSNNRLLIAAALNLIAALIKLLDHLGRVWRSFRRRRGSRQNLLLCIGIRAQRRHADRYGSLTAWRA